jgi:hypothetical protein
MRGITPEWGIRMRERAYNFCAHFSVVGHAPFCTDNCQYRHATRRKMNLETAYDPQREILRMRAITRA